MAKAKFDLTKDWLKEQNIKVLVNGIDTTDAECPFGVTRDDLIEVWHYSKHLGWKQLHPCLNVTTHDQGIIGECRYYMIGFTNTENHRTLPIPYHRFLYAWFNGIAHAGYDISHIDGNGTNNDLNNLIEESHPDNLARRKGAKNQYHK